MKRPLNGWFTPSLSRPAAGPRSQAAVVARPDVRQEETAGAGPLRVLPGLARREVQRIDAVRAFLPARLRHQGVRVPGQGSIAAFWIVVAAMVVMLGGLLTVFRRRGWL